DQAIGPIALSPDGKRMLVVVGREPNLTERELETGKVIHKLDGHRRRILSVAYSPDGRLGYSAGFDPRWIQWDLGAGTLIREAPVEGHKITTRIVASPDGKTLVSIGSAEVKIWDLADGVQPYNLANPDVGVSSRSAAVFSGDGSRLLLAGAHGPYKPGTSSGV